MAIPRHSARQESVSQKEFKPGEKVMFAGKEWTIKGKDPKYVGYILLNKGNGYKAPEVHGVRQYLIDRIKTKKTYIWFKSSFIPGSEHTPVKGVLLKILPLGQKLIQYGKYEYYVPKSNIIKKKK